MQEGGLKVEGTGSTRFHSTLEGSVRSFYFAEKQPVWLYCLAIPNNVTLLSYTQSWNILEVYPVFLHCKAIPNFNTLLIHTQS